ncbi:methyltransferase [Kitasatospora sp. MAP5-34]|uniref:methyltransferase n=1 Tax=Kitasatospora sp. MAP5-34 TaxID=3035102 RepID=UPI00247384F8|nr:methyltransferase [Kitasatospora sp. MAP5-34]MDH6578568.1 ubiquinone/menaquinone biosynthesis C-methylase UbiE [Kitasatospora sp. MAP5-34]
MSQPLHDFSQDPVHDRFQFLVNAPALFNAVVTAAELGIFEFLSKAPGSEFDGIREFTGLPAHQLRVLLHAVCTTGLLERRDGGYTNAETAERLLAPDAPDSWRHILVGWRDIYYPAFAHMTTALRAGTNTALAGYPGNEPTLYQRLAHTPELEAVFHASMSAFTMHSLSGLVEREEFFSSARHLLDVGGGDGTTTSALVQRYPDLRVTVFDMPSVARLAAGTTATGPDGRVELQAGDLFADAFPSGVDTVLFSHVLEIFSGEQIVALLSKAYEALPAGGRVLVYGYNVSDDETQGIFSARLSLYLNILASGQGMAYPAKDYEQWLRRAGFGDVSTIAGLPFEHGLTTGVKA